MSLPIPFVVIVAVLLCFFVYYLRRPSDVVAGAMAAGQAGARATVSTAKALAVIILAIAVIGAAVFLVKSIVGGLLAGGPVAGLLAYLILRDTLR
ncbi:hypothetical protein [Paraburkholderia tropica]|uniref:hypothetical protein n=1 Tax=Paraburkholderia tropica TaxID=92647 RepID=UPI003D2E0094